MSSTLLIFPIRLRVLVTLLFVTTVSVGFITVTMGNLFHKDKTGYIRDLVTVIATRTSNEAASVVDTYYRSLRVFSGLVTDRQLTNEETSVVIERLFQNHGEFVLLYIKPEGSSPVIVYNVDLIRNNGLSKNKLLKSLRYFTSTTKNDSGSVTLKQLSDSKEYPLVGLFSKFEMSEFGTNVTTAAVTQALPLWNIVNRSGVANIAITNLKGESIVNNKKINANSRGRIGWMLDFGGASNTAEEAFSSFTKEYSYDGEEYIGSVTRIGNSNLLAGANIPKSAVFLTARVLLRELVVMSLVLIAAVAIISVFLARRLTKSVEKLSHATSEVGKGRFDTLVDVNSRDEIGVLSNSFNKMVYELKVREAKLSEAQAALIQSEKLSAIGRLTAGIAHEVKNPLTGILGHAQLAFRKLDDDHPVKKNIEVIEQETVRCVEIIQDLMKFSRAEHTTSYEDIDVNKVVENTARIVGPYVSDHRSELTFNLFKNIPLVHGNANQIKQVVMNLVINALQAMGDASGKVKLSTDYKGGRVTVSVSDNGPGIPPDIQKQIFDPFFTTKPPGQGTGLGLSVAYGIIESHKGTIVLDSEIGKGTTFTLDFPESNLSGGSN